MVLDGPKPLKSIEKTNTFLDFRSFTKTMKKRCQRGPQKSCFLVQNGDMGLPGSTYPLIFDVLVRCQKIIIFGCPPEGPTNLENRALERQLAGKVAPARQQELHSEDLCPQAGDQLSQNFR